MVHEEIRVPKSFDPYSEGKDFKGYVNGIEVDNRVLLLDPYSYEDTNIVHFLVTGAELQRINAELGPSNYDNKEISFNLVPQSEIFRQSTGFYLVDTETFQQIGTNVNISWDNSYGVSDYIPFEFAFLDNTGNLIKDVRYGYTLFDQNDNALVTNTGNDPNNPGILATEGIDIQTIQIPTQEQYRIDVLVYGTGISYDQTYAGIGSGIIEVGPGVPSSPPPTPPKPVTPTPTPPSVQVPSWIQTTAGFWVDGFSSDDEFVNAIEFLINEGVIVIPPTASAGETAAEIPSWIKTTTGFWVDGFTSDEEFVTAIQWLIENGIMIIA